MRVVPNLFPALERQEVVVHTPRHARSVADLSDAELELVARAWRLRAQAVPGYVHALINEGREAGSSLPHSHSQLVWFAEEPPAIAAERDLSRLLEGERVLERDGLVLLCPVAPRLPYELLIAPQEPQADGFASDLLAPALALLAEAVRRLRAVAGPEPPLNAWLHTGRRWHIELLPRLTVMAGLELGAGVYVNTVSPESAAATLRKAEAPRRS